jgi:ribosomal subunit interface protein
MELVLKGRGARVAQRLRQVTEHKLARIERLEPALTRLEVVVTVEKNPRQGGVHRVEAAAATPRKTYRAHADAPDVDAALDVVAERLERQILDHHNRRRTRRNAGAGRVKSAQAPAIEAEADEDEDEAEAEDRDPGSTE